jgi:molecular chaperone GrpE (heat shock protein)
MPKGIYQRTKKHREVQRAWHALETPTRYEQRIAKQRATLAKKYEQLRLERARLRDEKRNLREKERIERARLRDEKNALRASMPLPPLEVQKAVIADVKNLTRNRDVMMKYGINRDQFYRILRAEGIHRPRGNPQPTARRRVIQSHEQHATT